MKHINIIEMSRWFKNQRMRLSRWYSSSKVGNDLQPPPLIWFTSSQGGSSALRPWKLNYANDSLNFQSSWSFTRCRLICLEGKNLLRLEMQQISLGLTSYGFPSLGLTSALGWTGDSSFIGLLCSIVERGEHQTFCRKKNQTNIFDLVAENWCSNVDLLKVDFSTLPLLFFNFPF